MKIKERNIGILLYVLIGGVVYFIFFLRDVLSTSNYFADFSIKAYVANGVVIFAIVYLVLSTIYGSYIEITNDELLRSEGYLKKYFSLKKIVKIYCAPHIFLGPSIFIEYRKDAITDSKEEKVLVLNLYRDEDKKNLLDFLADKYPEINQDENCKKIRIGEKIFLQPRAQK